MLDKKDGGIVNYILNDDGSMIEEQSEVSSILIEVLKKIQTNPLHDKYDNPIPFPELPKLDKEEIRGILGNISTGKALSYDLFADNVLKSSNILDKLPEILRDLWSKYRKLV